tara:strand:+ start:628 stop:1599 length:972 start_codon:yes stop_codon:yes gene_type:complete
MNNNLKIKILYEMIRMREVELKIQKEYSKEEMRCPIHLSVGQEAIPVGISNNLNNNDKVLSAHRSHFHYLAKGGSLKSMIAELYGKETGCAMGLGGSMHLIDIKANVVAAVPIVGSTIPIGVGVAWSNKLKGKNNDITVIYFGDGATEEGVFHESLDFASLFELNILFVCENNFYSVYSDISKRQNKQRSILKMARAHGIAATYVDGNDCEKVYHSSKSIIKNIKKNKKPHLIKLDTYRHLEHCGPNNDDNLKYRNSKEVKRWLKKDPIKTFQKKLLDKKIISLKDLEIFQKKIDKEINKAFEFAKNSPYPKNKKLLYKFIYS